MTFLCGDSDTSPLSMTNWCLYGFQGNCEEELPKKPVGQQITNRLPTHYQQLTDRLPRVSKIENLL